MSTCCACTHTRFLLLHVHAHTHSRTHAGSKERFADDERRQLAALSATHQSVLRQIAKTKAEMRDMEAETAAFREQLAAIGAAKAHKK